VSGKSHNLNITGIRNWHKVVRQSEGKEENCTGSFCPQRTAMFEDVEEEDKKKRKKVLQC